MKLLLPVGKNFRPAFWVANGMELFERLAYYGQNAVFSVYLRDHLNLTIAEAGKLQSLFGGLLYALPMVGGTIADALGFRRAFGIAFSLLGVGYFLIGSAGMELFRGVYSGVPLFPILALWIVLTAIGGSFIKPSVLGTVELSTSDEAKSFGYAIYYWLVNIGAALGPALAFAVRSTVGIEFVYLLSAFSCLLMVIVNGFFYTGVQRTIPSETLLTKLQQFVAVIRNGRFVLFLFIFSLFWLVFWQEFIVVPFYVRDVITPDAPFELIASAGAWGIILFQLIVNRLTKKLSAQQAIVLGFSIASFGWLLPAFSPSIPSIIAAIIVFSIGEMIQAPRYYEYIARLAPPNQLGMYQGFGFLPIAFAYAVGGIFGAWLYETVVFHLRTPEYLWYVLFGIGALATVLMLLYNAHCSKRGKIHLLQ